MVEKTYEVNFDGIVGPTHNYSGLSYGNIASKANKSLVSNPREAALQGLEKMKFLADLGIKQAVLPPQERPFIPILRQIGFSGGDQDIIAQVYRETPDILFAASSAAAMWTANAATVCPSIDAIDKHMHITPANLSAMFHRSIEAATTEAVLRKIFANNLYFTVHSPLPTGSTFSDEGAANHNLLRKQAGHPGLHLFVFGRFALRQNDISSVLYPARQTFEASAAIARRHTQFSPRVLFAQQAPEAVDAGAFHNDVIAVANDHLFFFHQFAFAETATLLTKMKRIMEDQCDVTPLFIEVSNNDIPLQTAVQTYLFNSQIVTLPDGSMIMIAPSECLNNYRVHKYLEDIVQSKNNPIGQLHYLDLRQSMQNGGGPACLRLRVTLNERELAATHQPIFLNEKLYNKLYKWITKHYRDRLQPSDLSDPQLLIESRAALDELTKILELGSIYPFQQELTR